MVEYAPYKGSILVQFQTSEPSNIIMSNTNRSTSTIPQTEHATPRKPWQIERGERYGNSRKSVAKDKRIDTKKDRAKLDREIVITD